MSDSAERRNLWDDPAAADRRARLATRLAAWRTETMLTGMDHLAAAR